jgi:hypothetical protein
MNRMRPQDSQFPGRGSNQILPECKSETYRLGELVLSQSYGDSIWCEDESNRIREETVDI